MYYVHETCRIQECAGKARKGKENGQKTGGIVERLTQNTTRERERERLDEDAKPERQQ